MSEILRQFYEDNKIPVVLLKQKIAKLENH